MSDESIHVADVSQGQAGASEDDPGESVELPVVDLLTGRGFVTGKSGGGKSILEGTPVHTESGRRPIEEVTRGDSVLSLNTDSYEQEYREVKQQIEHVDDQLVEITLEDGTQVVGTEDHSFLTADGLDIEPVRGEHVEPGVWMPVARSLPSAGSVTEVDLEQYVMGDSGSVAPAHRDDHRSSREGDDTLVLGFDVGWEIGLFLGANGRTDDETVRIESPSEAVKSRLQDRNYDISTAPAVKSDRGLAGLFAAQFSPTADWTMPGWVFHAPADFREGVVSGLYDATQTTVEGQPGFGSVSRAVASAVRELLRQYSVSVRTLSRDAPDTQPEKEGRVTIAVPADQVSQFAEILAPARRLAVSVTGPTNRGGSLTDDGPTSDCIPGGRALIDAAVSECPSKTPPLTDGGIQHRETSKTNIGAADGHLSTPRPLDRSVFNRLVDGHDIQGRTEAFGQSGIEWQRVVSVDTLDRTARVYDLDVRHNDNFVADGVFVHNSNTVSVVIERLLKNGHPCLVVDLEGEYYGLKQDYEVLHVGADDECDIVVSPEHAEKLATLALEQNVPIILDLSGYLEEDAAKELLLKTTQQLFAKEKTLRKPFLMVLEECHEFMPEGGGLDETGRMLIKVGKRGRKHGLGIVGISQRPADVKKDFITQCDWLVWHRLTWENDTTVVSRILGSGYANAVEDLGDGEAFMMTDWDERIRRVQFHRKDTFDAGATPGLDDVERPELKSVSGNLVTELEEISEEQARRESQLADLQQELDKKRQQISQLEHELEEARDLSQMADRFSQALLGKAEAPYRQTTGPGPRDFTQPSSRAETSETVESADASDSTADRAGNESSADGAGTTDAPDSATGKPATSAESGSESSASGSADNGQLTDEETQPEVSRDAEPVSTTGPSGQGHDSESARDDSPESASTSASDTESDSGRTPPDSESDPDPDPDSDWDQGNIEPVSRGQVSESSMEHLTDTTLGTREAVIAELQGRIDKLPRLPTAMLRHYRRKGVSEPVAAHIDAGGDGDSQHAYSRNRPLRVEGLVQHDSGGEYEYALPDLVRDAYADRLDDAQVASMVTEVESVFIDDDDIDRDAPTESGAKSTGDSPTDASTAGTDGSSIESDTESVDHLSADQPQPRAKLPDSIKLAAITDSVSSERPPSDSTTNQSASSAKMAPLFSSQSEDSDGNRDPAAETGLSDAAKRIAKNRTASRTLETKLESESEAKPDIDSESDKSGEGGPGPVSGADRRSRDGTIGRGGSRSSRSRR